MAREELNEELLALFDYKPPSTRVSEDSAVKFSYPNMFYDRHLDSRLSLKHVKPAPSLHHEIADLVEDKLGFLKDKKQFLPLTKNSEDRCRFSTRRLRKKYPPQTIIEDAKTTAKFYDEASFFYCASIASTIDLYPHAPTWLTILNFNHDSERLRNPDPAMIDTCILEILHYPKTRELKIPQPIWGCLDEELRNDIRKISDNFEGLASFQFHVPLTEVEEMFKNMGSTAKKYKAPSLKCSAVDYVIRNEIPFSVGPDSITTIELLPSIAAAHPNAQEIRRSMRLNHQKETRADIMSTNSGTRTNSLPVLMVKRSIATKLDSTVFIQRAWTRAVEYDATLVVFNCGSYERIGIRHRGSQTLFLSDLIDVSKGSDPAYGKLQIGVYMMIMRDVLDRVRQVKSSTIVKTIASKKRLMGDPESTHLASKRPKTRAATANESKTEEKEPVDDTHSIILHETSRRTLALLRMQYGMFNSPAPAVLHRTGCATIPYGDLESKAPVTNKKKRKYTPNEYFVITLTSEIAGGATGNAHDAKIEVQTGDGQIYSCEGVVKVAFEDENRQKLRHEHAVYGYLATKGVKGVVTVYGLFEDTLNEAMILVMSHAGTSLVRQPHYKKHGEVSLNNEEKEAFKTAMSEIHDAGVRHYDIRPENLMVDSKGRAIIIDFDMAKVGAGKHSREREFTHLCDLLNGEYDPPNQWESPPTSVSVVSPQEDGNLQKEESNHIPI